MSPAPQIICKSTSAHLVGYPVFFEKLHCQLVIVAIASQTMQNNAQVFFTCWQFDGVTRRAAIDPLSDVTKRSHHLDSNHRTMTEVILNDHWLPQSLVLGKPHLLILEVHIWSSQPEHVALFKWLFRIPDSGPTVMHQGVNSKVKCCKAEPSTTGASAKPCWSTEKGKCVKPIANQLANFQRS